jgi:5-methylthioadenosine/S-adenosylhomocysteine deaminase
VHCIAVDHDDVEALAGARVGIAHCPTANRMFPGGTTPVAALRAAGAAVGVGLDNASLNPRFDLLAESRAATVAVRAGGGTLTALDALAMATCEAARAIGMADRIGSLEVGRRADVVVMDTSGPHWHPHADWASALLWQSRPEDVRTVLVDGRVVVDDGICRTLAPDERAVARGAARAQAGVRRR